MKPFLFLRIALYYCAVQQFRQAVTNSGDTSSLGIIPTESFKVKQSSRFEKFIRGKKIEINYQQRQLGIFEFHWVTSEMFHHSILPTSHLIK